MTNTPPVVKVYVDGVLCDDVESITFKPRGFSCDAERLGLPVGTTHHIAVTIEGEPHV